MYKYVQYKYMDLILLQANILEYPMTWNWLAKDMVITEAICMKAGQFQKKEHMATYRKSHWIWVLSYFYETNLGFGLVFGQWQYWKCLQFAIVSNFWG